MAGSSETAPVLQAKPGGDQIFQAMTGKKKTLEDLGVTKVILTYVENGVHLVIVRVVTKDTLDKITNTLEDEAIA